MTSMRFRVPRADLSAESWLMARSSFAAFRIRCQQDGPGGWKICARCRASISFIHTPALIEAARAGIVVVLTSRAIKGIVEPAADAARDGFMNAGDLSPVKARILLM